MDSVAITVISCLGTMIPILGMNCKSNRRRILLGCISFVSVCSWVFVINNIPKKEVTKFIVKQSKVDGCDSTHINVDGKIHCYNLPVGTIVKRYLRKETWVGPIIYRQQESFKIDDDYYDSRQ